MTTIIIKTINGEEIIASLDSKNENEITVSKPRKLVLQGSQGGLMPYIISSPDAEGIVINRRAIAAMFEAPQDVANSYLQATTSILLS